MPGKIARAHRKRPLGCALLTLLAGPLFAATKPQVWFAPLDDISRTGQVKGGVIPASDAGPTDFMSLFTPGAAWASAESQVSVFKMYEEPLTGNLVEPGMSDFQLQQIFAYLRLHNIALALELPALMPTAPCAYINQSAGVVVEGFAGGAAQAAVNRIVQDGGILAYVAMDEPYQQARDACGWTPQQVATNAMTVLNIVRSAFPNVIVGDIEVVPDNADPAWLTDYAAWFDTFQQVTGQKLGFFTCDTGFLPGWMPNVSAIHAQLTQRNIPMAMIYDGFPTDTSDAEWIGRAQQMYTQYELAYGAPDIALFQSWMAFPIHNLPETTPDTFTWLIDQYVLPRPALSLNLTSSVASGKLSAPQTPPIASAPIVVTAQPTAGNGVIATYTLTGTVPAGIGSAIVQACINLCGTQGASSISLYSFAYADSGAKSALNFNKGLAGWGVDPSGGAVVQTGSDEGGPYLHISSTPSQSTYVNSSTFAVTPGSAYTLTITARISPDSLASGYFALIFLVTSEVSRDTLDFATGTLTLVSGQTASDGSYNLPFTPIAADGAFQVTAYYPGSSTLWPAQAVLPLTIAPAISVNGIVNSADFQPEALSPGAWFTIFGQNLGASAQWTSASQTTLGDTTVTVCGAPAVLSYNSGPVTGSGSPLWQLNALLPASASAQTSCPVIVTVDGQPSAASTIAIAAGVTDLFTFTASSGLLPLLTHSDYTLVGPASAGLRPAAAAEEIIGWGTGDCKTQSVTVGSVASAVLFSGIVEPGLCQINFRIPSGLTGANPLRISSSTQSYTVWLQ